MKNMNWNSYATKYDLMAQNNPAYQKIVQKLQEHMTQWKPPTKSLIVDLGAGTGNFSFEIARKFPQCTVICVDSDPSMLEIAKNKLVKNNLLNFEIVNKNSDEYFLEAKNAYACCCIHSLYTMKNYMNIISSIYKNIQNEGKCFFCDIGRILDITDWSFYLFKVLLRNIGLRKTLSTFIDGREIAKSNKKISKLQSTGEYWTHTHEEFIKVLKDVGFDIEYSEIVYRGYSDLVYCTKSVISTI